MDIHETTHFLNKKVHGSFIDWFKSVRVILVDIAKENKKKYNPKLFFFILLSLKMMVQIKCTY